MRIHPLLTATLALACIWPGTQAQTTDFPSRPVRLIVPYAAGGGPDVLARKIAEPLAKELGAPVVVENKVGAGGMLAGEFAARAKPDGYTVMLGSSTHVTQKILQPGLRFDPLRDFVHVVRTDFSPQVLVVNADTPYRDVQALIAAARAASDPFNYASGGIGSAAHLAAAAFTGAAGIETVHVPYRGSVEIVPALLSGDVQFALPIASTALPQVASGKVRALAVTSAKRLPQLPDVPTLTEVFQRDDLALEAWSGMWVPAGTPPEVVDKLEAAVKQVYAIPEIQEFHGQVGVVTSLSANPAEFTRFIETETDKYHKLITDNQIGTQP